MGAIFFNSNYYYFSTWRPDTWISFCVSADDDGSYTTLIDGEVALEQDAAEYDMAHKKESGNFFLLNAIPLDYPYYGSITDINIWDRALTREEADQWSSCNFEEGNYLKWSTAQFNITGNIQSSDINKDQVLEI